VSGSKASRAVLDGLVARVQSGELSGIVVAKLDRLSRLRPKDRVLLLESIEDAGGVVLSASEQMDTTTREGRFTRELFLSLARMEWEKYRDGFEDAKRRAIENGIPVVTRPAVGYRRKSGMRNGKKDRRLEVNERVAPVILELFERRTTGAGPVELGELLEAHGVRTSQGSRTWSKQAVYGLIKNPLYRGVLRYGNDDRFTQDVPELAIVDLATWTAAQHPNGRQLVRTSAKSAWLLAGIARCWSCRYAMQGTTTSRGKRIYRCTRRHAGGECPAPARIDADTLEAAVVDAFWQLTSDLAADGSPIPTADLSAPETALERAERRLAQVEQPDMQDALGDRWPVVVRERRDDRERAATDLGRARAEVPADVVDTVTLREVWDRVGTRERRDLLHARFDVAAVAKDHRLTMFPAGTAPADVPRRGYLREPVLRSFADAA
jgi:DNA invertase Pin-like site-specific DNA recombinase